MPTSNSQRREMAGESNVETSDEATVELAEKLIACRSVTPDDAGCLPIIVERLTAIGFRCEFIDRGRVRNLWSRRGQNSPVLCLAGHTDVVPSGPLEQWHSDPFRPIRREGMLYGRGAADMKGSLAAFVTAVESYVAANPAHGGSIAFLLTSDEEGDAIDGTVAVTEALRERGEHPQFTGRGRRYPGGVAGQADPSARRTRRGRGADRGPPIRGTASVAGLRGGGSGRHGRRSDRSRGPHPDCAVPRCRDRRRVGGVGEFHQRRDGCGLPAGSRCSGRAAARWVRPSFSGSPCPGSGPGGAAPRCVRGPRIRVGADPAGR